jgi:hypothetical protein
MPAVKQLKSLGFWTRTSRKMKAAPGIGPEAAYFCVCYQALTPT